ncbi:hypothetical protein [Bacteriovorax sp. DB6_IX]|uniref:hypothetical protein n=1 Tax=Bacteriovorax sp. DB6_IX TaxID=1353530 RepID=UPI00038A335F|nr:hypothetical protein [Bacteriovorax sp. DB6_IX]EQC52256.1 hypothetical protein M901_1651 [Bacteriovorax sp. DB6_IX]
MKRLFLLLCLFQITVFAEYARVSVDGNGLPANDLVSEEYGMLDPEMALMLSQEEGLDLSKLNPEISDIWDGRDNFLANNFDENLPIENDDTVVYGGSIKSPTGIMRFNAVMGDKRFQIHLSKKLHTILLRKNLLRKLGYIVPSMKYLKSLTVQFETEEAKNNFKDVELVSDLIASSTRWIIAETPTSVTLQDIFVKMPQATDFYDIALTMVPGQLESRSLRSAIIPYALADMGESINKLSYKAAKISNNHIILAHDTEANFNATLDDLKWMGRKLAKLTRSDFQEIVKNAHYPQIVSQILVEKLIARRNSILKTIGIDYKEMSYKKDLELPGMEKGYLHTQEFQGYASRFSHGMQKGPLDDFWRYVVSEVQSSAISSLADYANDYLKAVDFGEERLDWTIKDFKKYKDYAIEEFTRTGEFPALPFQKWSAPLLEGKLNLGRDIVIGGSLGTDNFVQLADTAGFGFNLGAYVGLERVFSQLVHGNAIPKIGVNVNYTHVKPISSLKEALKEPYKNILVNFLTKRVQRRLGNIRDGQELELEDRYEMIAKNFKEISENLGVGESLIISEDVVPDMSVTLRGPLFDGGSSFYVQGGAKYKTLKRIQIFRKSRHQFQVYFDDGNLREIYGNGGITYFIPVFTGAVKKSVGNMTVNFFDLNLNPDLEENPDFYKNVTKLYSIIQDRTLESVGDAPVQIESKINDRSGSFNWLFFVHKTARKLQDLFIKFTGAKDTGYIVTSYGSQTGTNYVHFLKTIANYYLRDIFEGFSFSSNPFANAGRTFKGKSKTLDMRFEAKVKDTNAPMTLDNLYSKYMMYTYRYEGGDTTEKKLWKKLKDFNEKFKKDLFSRADAQDAGAMLTYKVQANLHFYEKAVEKLLSLTDAEFKALGKEVAKSYGNEYRCRYSRNNDNNSNMTISQEIQCGDLDYIRRLRSRCNKYYRKQKLVKAHKCVAEYGRYFAKYMDFEVLSDLLGKENLYLESSINGFRRNHEYLYRPIYGNTFGRQNGQFTDGPIAAIRKFLGIMKGEMEGNWFRVRL